MPIVFIQQCEFRSPEKNGAFDCSWTERPRKSICYDDCAVCPLMNNQFVAEQPVDETAPEVDQRRMGIGDVVAGGIGVAKAFFGIDKSPDELISERYNICQSCDKNNFGMCAICNCYIAAKVRIAGESCPINKWSPFDGQLQPVHRTEN